MVHGSCLQRRELRLQPKAFGNATSDSHPMGKSRDPVAEEAAGLRAGAPETAKAIRELGPEVTEEARGLRAGAPDQATAIRETRSEVTEEAMGLRTGALELAKVSRELRSEVSEEAGGLRAGARDFGCKFTFYIF